MAANYLHGVETIEVFNNARPVNVVKSAVIGVVGIAPTGPSGVSLLLSDRDGAQFGATIPGFTLPQALAAIYKKGSATIVAVNVFDAAKHSSNITAEAVSFDIYSHKAKLQKTAIIALALSAAGTPLVQGLDYRLDAALGTLTWLPGAPIPAADTLQASYSWVDPAKVSAADIIGTIDQDGQRSGLQALSDTYTQFGFCAKILITPGYSSSGAVAAELGAIAQRMEAVAYVDAPAGTTFADVLAGRGPNGAIAFNTSNGRVRLCYPHVKVSNAFTGDLVLEPLSAHAAGVRAQVDLKEGYWISASNHEIPGILGLERPLSAKIDDPQSEVNLLNEVGITTVFNAYGTGMRLWGNRMASFPSDTDMRTFENVRRTADIINESIRNASLQFIDRYNITPGVITAVVETVNAFGRKLVGDGALLGMTAWYDPARNSAKELEKGHLLINYKFTPPTPLERLTYESEITDEYLVILSAQAASSPATA